MARNWTRDELLLVMNLYCKVPFGKFHRGNPDVIRMAGLIERTPSAVAMKLSNLASLDPHHAERGVKGLSGASNADRAIWDEFHSGWELMAEQSEALLRQKTGEGQAKSPEDHAPFSGQTEGKREVKVRLAQTFFRTAVLSSYDLACCVTGMSIPTLLVASHILPWSTHPGERVNPHNGLCLNSLFDRAFDRGLITFDEDFRLVLSRELRDTQSREALNRHFLHYEGQPLRTPQKFQPNKQFLGIHRETVYVG